MMRGINRQAIFDDEEDCQRFMDILADLPFQHDDDGRLLPIRTCVVYAWCLMTNHFHLLVMEKDWKIAEVIKSLASSYVFYYNKKNERIGHLFQERLTMSTSVATRQSESELSTVLAAPSVQERAVQ